MTQLSIWFTGMPGSGKSTLGDMLANVLKDEFAHKVVRFDGDIVRREICKDLGFTNLDRIENNMRVLWATAYLPGLGITPIVTLILPFTETRRKIRKVSAGLGTKVILIYTKCSECVLRERDPKNLYKLADSGALSNMTGIDSPYQDAYSDSDLTINTELEDPVDSLKRILNYLEYRKVI